MNRFNPKYTTVIVALSLLVSGGLQVVWLRQLFSAQQKQLKDDIEHLVGTTAQTSWYRGVSAFEKPQNLKRVKQLFLSPQWAQLRRALDNMVESGLSTKFSIESGDDSTALFMNFRLPGSPKKKNNSQPVTSNTGLTPEQLHRIDSLSLISMKKGVAAGLLQMGITSPVYYNIYNFNMTSLQQSNLPKGLMPAYTSNGYLYGIQDHYKYQLCLPAIGKVVWYRMRYYVASAVLMMLLTGAAFYIILRLLRNARLYADAKADFTRNMTHELKTPIATVSLALESIQKYNLASDPQTLQNYIDISRHELQRLDLMVEKALNIGVDGNAAIPFNPELYDVQTGLQQVVASMQLQLLNTNSGIEFHPSAEPCFVFGDPVHLTNIFYNLADNAIKYTGSGLLLEISCTCDADVIIISFKDNGPGIDKIYQKNIFDKFFRIPAKGNTHNVKGTGIGLNYVRQMVEKHGGTIRVKSEPGGGASFIITLKAAL
ncbi:MAG: HAMP domain-containing sensor histidine kinase [Bacteroidota bacterium]